MLKSSASVDRVVSRLVDIAAFFHFDGWLINIECAVEADLIGNLVLLVRRLTDAMHSHDPKRYFTIEGIGNYVGGVGGILSKIGGSH